MFKMHLKHGKIEQFLVQWKKSEKKSFKKDLKITSKLCKNELQTTRIRKSFEFPSENALKSSQKTSTNLFRPPYGKITPQVIKKLENLDYQIIMWDVLSGDFDNSIAPEKCLKNVLNNTEAGSIIVFHDSLKAYDKLTYVLPKVLKHFSNLGYTFERITI